MTRPSQFTPRQVALDGPAGVGKSTIGKLLADRRDLVFLDTGVLYRAVSLAALDRGVESTDDGALAEIARSLDIEILRPEPGSERMYIVCIEGHDVTDVLRSPDVEAIVSVVSAHPAVRAELLTRQRELAEASPSVLVGRDIGTVVLPNADVKIYLDASLHERARRRHTELLARGRRQSFEDVVLELQRRDKSDTERAVSPLRIPEDAIVVDTDGKDIEEVLQEIESRMGAVLADTK